MLFALPGQPALTWLALLAIAGVSLWRVADRRTPAPVAGAIAMTALGLGLLPGWTHYFAFLPFAQAVALGRARGAGLAAALTSAALCVLPALAIAQGWSIYFHWSRAGGATLSALAVWVALVTLPLEGAGSDPSAE